MVIDISAETNVVWVNPSAHITNELIRRIDAIAKPQPATKPPGR